MINRGPFDPLSFTPPDMWSDKATQILKAICPGRAKWKVEEGRVILLEGEPSELALRMIITDRGGYTQDKLKKMEEKLGKAYGKDGVVRADTRGLTPSDVARRVAEIVHLEKCYSVCNLHEQLKCIEKEGTNGVK